MAKLNILPVVDLKPEWKQPDKRKPQWFQGLEVGKCLRDSTLPRQADIYPIGDLCISGSALGRYLGTPRWALRYFPSMNRLVSVDRQRATSEKMWRVTQRVILSRTFPWSAWLSSEVQRYSQGEQLQAQSEHPALSKTHLTKDSWNTYLCLFNIAFHFNFCRKLNFCMKPEPFSTTTWSMSIYPKGE